MSFLSLKLSKVIIPLVKNRSVIKAPKYDKRLFVASFAICTSLLTGCQTITPPPSTPTIVMVGSDEATYPELLEAFKISGKIGVTVPKTQSTAAQTGSAFYVWAQEDERFAIDITGALGIGQTMIEYNGSEATLISERTSKVTANSPEDLLIQATGWQAPISNLRYWISGRPAPADTSIELDSQGRIHFSNNDGWTAEFTFKDAESKRPSKIKAVRDDGHKVIMTINHVK